MIVESLVMLVYAASGTAVARALGLRGWGLAPLGFLMGIALHICVTGLLVVLGLPTLPLVALGGDVAVAVAALVWAVRSGRPVAVSWWRAGAVGAGIVAVVGALRGSHLVRWHIDSLQYLDAGALLATNHYREGAGTTYATKRMIGVGAIHEPANLIGEYYLTAVTLLLTLAGLAAIVWILACGLDGRVAPATTAWFAGAAVVALVSTNRFVFHSFYLNGHVLTGMLLVAVAGCAWLMMLGRLPVAVGVGVCVLGTGALVLTRPEGAVMAVLAVLPAVVSPSFDRRARRWVLAALGAWMVLWQAFVVAVSLHDSGSPDRFAALQVVVGAAAIVVAVAPAWALIERWSRFCVLAVEAALWLAVAAFAVRSPDILTRSLEATWENRVAGKWGYTVFLLAALVVAAVAVFRLTYGSALRLMVTAFLPLVFVLAYVRGGPYRVGHYDSLNRMWLQVLPLAAMYVAAALAAGQWRDWIKPLASRLGFEATPPLAA